MQKKKPVTTWLLVGFFSNLLMIVLITTISFVGLYKINQSYDHFNTIISNRTVILITSKTLDDIEVTLQKLNSDILKYPENSKLSKKQIIKFQYKIDLLIKKFSVQNIDLKVKQNFIDKFKDQYTNYKKINAEIIYNKDFKDTKKLTALKNELQSEFELLKNTIDKQVTYSIERRLELAKQNEEFFQGNRKILQLLIFLVVTLGIFLLLVSALLGSTSVILISKYYKELSNKENVLTSQNKQLQEKEETLNEKNIKLETTLKDLDKANKELIIINKRLMELDQMKSNFISTVSHELRTPLTSIKGSLGLILSGIVEESNDEVKTFLDVCYRNTDRLVKLINDLLDISKIESGKIQLNKRDFNLSDSINTAIEGINSYAQEKNVSLIYNSKSKNTVYGDNYRIEQVLYNLLSNAIKFSSNIDNQKGIVEIIITQSENETIVQVRDNGIGIPDSLKEYVFEKFTQVDSSSTRNSSGTGLGLAICKSIIKEHNGSIWVEKYCPKGTIICFSLPSKENQLKTNDT